MRTFTVILSFGMTVMLLGCGLLSGGENPPDSESVTPSTVSENPPSVVTPSSTLVEGPLLAATAPLLYFGAKSLEERIFDSPVIARVRLDSTTSTVEYGTPAFQGAGYLTLLEFNFSVQEYLKGSGATNIVAVWHAYPLFNTRQEAQDALPDIVAARDTQWDDREAIVFLQNSRTHLPSTQQTGRFFLSSEYNPAEELDDGYSIASRHHEVWLPATAAIGAPSQPSGDLQSFLMDVPPTTGTAPTITLGEMKSRIAGVAAKLDAGDGSREYVECVRLTYQYEREERNYWATYPNRSGSSAGNVPTHEHEFDSGLAMGSILYEDDLGFGPTAENLNQLWLDGGDVDLFNVEFGETVPYDSTGDGVNDIVNFTRQVLSARPLPEGEYRFHYNDRGTMFALCDGWTIRYEWTVTSMPPMVRCTRRSSIR